MSDFRLTRVQERQLIETLRRTYDVRQYRRSLAVLECGRGKPVNEVAAVLHVTRQSVHNWVTRYRRAGQCTALADRVHRGRPRRADRMVDAFLQELMRIPPAQCGYHATHWTVPLLQDQLQQHLNQTFCDATIRRVLHRLGYVWKRPRYVLAVDAEREKKVSYPARAWQPTAAQRRAGGG